MKSTLCLTVGILLLAISELAAATLYVSQGSMNPTPPYSTWDTAARNIQDAVNAAEPGATLMVTNGVYAGVVRVSKPLTLLSLNGPQFTIIDGGGTNRCLNAASRVYLSGFTLTNGRAPSALSPDTSYWDGGAVWSTWQSAFLTNCMLSGNSASNGGAAYSATMYNCTLTGNRGYNGGGAFVCDLYNCTLTGNSATNWGGGAYYGSLNNCIVYYNASPNGENYRYIGGITNCCTTPDAGVGEGNITAAPMFVDYAGGNLRLQANSPCIDAGNNALAYSTTDLDGNPRMAGSSVDIGAYEFQPSGPPTIAQQPLSQTAYVGGSVTFRVGASGSPPLSWQWRFNENAILDATNSSLTLPVVTASQAGSYTVVVTNSLGSATSEVAVLTVLDAAPSMTLQPLSQTVYFGSNVTFYAGAAGSLPLSWQWRFNDSAIQDATNSSLALPAVTAQRAGNYYVVVTNALGAVTSQVAVLTVRTSGTGPTITMQPATQTVYVGSNVTMSVGVTGGWSYSFQWWFNENPIPGATWSILTLPSVTPNQAGNYFAVVTDATGSVMSQVAVLTVLDSAPVITVQPLSQEVTAGLTVRFTVEAKGTLPMSLQWQFNGTAIPEATNSSLTLAAVTADQAGSYSVVLSNAVGSVTSASAALTVRLPAISYVWQESPNPTPPYRSWETAAHIIQEAVDAATPGDEIVVTNGIYATGGRTVGTDMLTNRVAVEKAVSIRSVNGPEVTVIQGYQVPGVTNGDAAVRCVYLVGKAELSGFTLTNGATRQEFREDSGGGVWGEWDDGWSRVRNCRIVGNSAYSTGGGAYGCELENCILVGNTANSGGGAYVGALRNCTVVSNSAVYTGGIYASSCYNSIMYYNEGGNWSGSKGSIITFCCTTPNIGIPGWNNIDAEPRFVDMAAGDFRLQADSPCINAGNNAFVSATTDFAGNARIVGGTVDLGAHEFQSPGSLLSYAWLQQYGLPTDGSADYADSDGEGVNNLQEWMSGTCPTNALSVLSLLSATPTSSNVTVRWNSVAGVKYFLERTANPQLSFTPASTNFVLVVTNLFGQAGTTTYADTNSTGPGSFYRVGVGSP